MTTANLGSLADRAAQVFALYQAGRRERMADLVDLLTPVLWHTARSQRLDHQQAEDAVQTAWLRLVENVDSVKDPQAVLGWLVTTVRREAWRVTRREDRMTVTDEPPESGVDQPLAKPAIADPAAEVVLEEGQRLLWGHIQRLPLRCQELLRVIAFSDRPDYAEISHALGMPVGSIGPTRGRCLAKLKTALQADPTWSAS
jgi:RNA polymerase sigma factor (sigma-70 family)